MVSKRTIIKKLLVGTLAVAPLLAAVYGFHFFLYAIEHFRMYHVKAYAAFFEYFWETRGESLSRFFASAMPLPHDPAGKKPAQAIPVLLYHGVRAQSDDLNTSIGQFKDQMFALKRAGYQTVSIEDYAAFLKGEKTLPEKSFLLTFDDGRTDSFYPTDPILSALGYRAVMFVITDIMGTANGFYLSEKELARMQKTGRWEIQSHSSNAHHFAAAGPHGEKGHYLSNKLWIPDQDRLETESEFRSRIGADLLIAKNTIAEKFRVPFVVFAFPFGDFGHDSVNFPEGEPVILETAKNIYPLAFYQVWPGKEVSFNYPDKNSFLQKRIEVRSKWTSGDLLAVLENGEPKGLPYEDDFTRDHGWHFVWGETRIEKGALVTRAEAASNGSSLFLDGSGGWRDIMFKARIERKAGSHFYLLARFRGDKNYAECNFGGNLVHIEQVVDGTVRVIRGEDKPFAYPASEFEAGIRVEGRNVQCVLDGRVMVESEFLDPSLAEGAIGFKTWDPVPHTSEIRVRGISVEPIPGRTAARATGKEREKDFFRLFTEP